MFDLRKNFYNLLNSESNAAAQLGSVNISFLKNVACLLAGLSSGVLAAIPASACDTTKEAKPAWTQSKASSDIRLVTQEPIVMASKQRNVELVLANPFANDGDILEVKVNTTAGLSASPQTLQVRFVDSKASVAISLETSKLEDSETSSGTLYIQSAMSDSPTLGASFAILVNPIVADVQRTAQSKPTADRKPGKKVMQAIEY